jgi:hypothetical protein
MKQRSKQQLFAQRGTMVVVSSEIYRSCNFSLFAMCFPADLLVHFAANRSPARVPPAPWVTACGAAVSRRFWAGTGGGADARVVKRRLSCSVLRRRLAVLVLVLSQSYDWVASDQVAPHRHRRKLLVMDSDGRVCAAVSPRWAPVVIWHVFHTVCRETHLIDYSVYHFVQWRMIMDTKIHMFSEPWGDHVTTPSFMRDLCSRFWGELMILQMTSKLRVWVPVRISYPKFNSFDYKMARF